MLESQTRCPPPSGLRMVAYRAARYWATEHGHQQPDDRMVDAVVAALFGACTVRERWYVKLLNKHGHSSWTRIFNHYAEAVEVEAMMASLSKADAEIERLREIRDAAVRWRAQFSKPADTRFPRMAALIEAVDKLTEVSA